MARGYQSYRGRRSAITKLIIAVLVLILLAACAFMMMQRYATYTDDGQIHFDLPFLSGLFDKEEEEDPPPETEDEPGSQDVSLVIGEGESGQVVEPLPADPEPVQAESPRQLLLLDALPADAASLTDALGRAGANGFVYPIRDDTGRVFYASPTAVDKAAVGSEADTGTLTSLCAAEGTAVARFNCFHDSYYAFVHMKEAAVCQKTGYVWYDNRSYHWLDPSKEQARSYVTGLAVECAQMGFDELLLEDLAYPTRGKLEKIDYSGNTMGKTEALVLFLTELRTALEPYGTKLSLLLSEEQVQAGSDAESGVDLPTLLPLVDAVYVETADIGSVTALLQGYVGEAEPPELVPVLQEPREGAWCLKSAE